MLMEIVHSGHATCFPAALPENTEDCLLLREFLPFRLFIYNYEVVKNPLSTNIRFCASLEPLLVEHGLLTLIKAPSSGIKIGVCHLYNRLFEVVMKTQNDSGCSADVVIAGGL